MESFENSNASEGFPEEKREKPIRERVAMPHIEPLIDILEKEFEGTEKIAHKEAIRSILNTVLEEIIEKTALFDSKSLGASFPYTAIDTAEISRRLYTEFGGEDPGPGEAAPAPQGKKEFFFGSVQTTSSGSPFGFFEETLHKIIKDIPVAVQELKKGGPLAKHEIYVLGSPTNELGSVGPDFLRRLEDGRAFDAFGDLYAEFVKEKLGRDGEKGAENISFHGISMGGSFATETAEKLLKEHILTQSRNEKDKPFLQVRIDTPPGPNKNGQGLKMYAGFLLDAAYTYFTDPYIKQVAFHDKSFLSEVNAVLVEKGIPVNMTEEQAERKKAGLREIFSSLKGGVPLPEGLKVTEIIGTRDALMYSPAFNKKVEEQQEKFSGTLGEKLVSDPEEPGRRTFGADMRHSIPYLRHNELVRIQHAAKILYDLKNPA